MTRVAGICRTVQLSLIMEFVSHCDKARRGWGSARRLVRPGVAYLQAVYDHGGQR